MVAKIDSPITPLEQTEKTNEIIDDLGDKLYRAEFNGVRSNCVTEIPQDIKLELSSGTLTLKAGSKVYSSSGVWKVMSYDSSVSWGYSGSGFVFVKSDGGLAVNNTGSESVSTLPTPATTYKIFYNTTDGKCYFDSNNSQMEEISFPIATFTADNGIKSIDQVFNGFGYIGSIVFALPGVKGLIPNGRNEDGTLNNFEKTLSSVATYDFSNRGGTDLFFVRKDDDTLSPFEKRSTYIDYFPTPAVDYWYLVYSTKDNQFYVSDSGGAYRKVYYLICGQENCIYQGNIDSFTPKTAFHALDWNDKGAISGFGMPSNKYINLTLLSSGSTYTAPANGYFVISKRANAVGQYLAIGNETIGYQENYSSVATQIIPLIIGVKKGDVVAMYYNVGGVTERFSFVYAEGEV